MSLFSSKATSVAKGLLTYIPFLYAIARSRHAGGTVSPDYCYSVWLKHLCLVNETTQIGVPKAIAELGPGSSIGVGAAALLSGAETYTGVDVFPYFDPDASQEVTRQLAERFGRCQPVAVEGWPDFSHLLDSKGFPSSLLSSDVLDKSLEETRCAAIVRAIGKLPGDQTNGYVAYRAPWDDASIVAAASIDLVLSHSVLEHVSNLPSAMASVHKWLRPGGVMSHQFDLQSHGITPAWDGHRAYSDATWKLVVGKRPTLINRLSFTQVVDVIRDAGFKILRADRLHANPTLARNALGPGWKHASDDDLRTSGGYVVAEKAA